jgi:hypothetical protein
LAATGQHGMDGNDFTNKMSAFGFHWMFQLP